MRAARASGSRREAPCTQYSADWSIPGDQQEKGRIQLEQEVLKRIRALDYVFENTDTHSRGSGARTGGNTHDRDIPDPHRGAQDGTYSPGGDLSISSFARGGYDAFGITPNTHPAQVQTSTYLEGGNESAFRGEDTVSTAHHHASAVTLGAGFDGNAAGPPSVREFDRDRERKLTDSLAARAGSNASAAFSQNRPSKKQYLWNRRDPVSATQIVAFHV